MRYVGSSTNPHGLTVATMPRRNDRPRFTGNRLTTVRRCATQLAASIGPVASRIVPSAATNSVTG